MAWRERFEPVLRCLSKQSRARRIVRQKHHERYDRYHHRTDWRIVLAPRVIPKFVESALSVAVELLELLAPLPRPKG